MSPRPDGSKPPLMPRVLGLVLAALLLASLAALSVIFWFIRPAKDTIPFEIAKAVLQLGVVATAAAAISILIFEYQREREKVDKALDSRRRDIENRDDLLKSILGRAVFNYNSVKKARRLLEARGTDLYTGMSFGGSKVKPTKMMKGSVYDDCIDTIIDIQLEFETLKREMESPIRFLENQDVVAVHFKEMESYLNELIDEYQERRRTFTTYEIELTKLPKLAHFLADSKKGSYWKFASSLNEVQRHIHQALVHRSPANPA